VKKMTKMLLISLLSAYAIATLSPLEKIQSLKAQHVMVERHQSPHSVSEIKDFGEQPHESSPWTPKMSGPATVSLAPETGPESPRTRLDIPRDVLGAKQNPTLSYHLRGKPFVLGSSNVLDREYATHGESTQEIPDEEDNHDFVPQTPFVQYYPRGKSIKLHLRSSVTKHRADYTHTDSDQEDHYHKFIPQTPFVKYYPRGKSADLKSSHGGMEDVILREARMLF
jgi:hypothetical protein